MRDDFRGNAKPCFFQKAIFRPACGGKSLFVYNDYSSEENGRAKPSSLELLAYTFRAPTQIIERGKGQKTFSAAGPEDEISYIQEKI